MRVTTPSRRIPTLRRRKRAFSLGHTLQIRLVTVQDPAGVSDANLKHDPISSARLPSAEHVYQYGGRRCRPQGLQQG